MKGFLKGFIPPMIGLVIHPVISIAIAGLILVILFIKPKWILG